MLPAEMQVHFDVPASSEKSWNGNVKTFACKLHDPCADLPMSGSEIEMLLPDTEYVP